MSALGRAHASLDVLSQTRPVEAATVRAQIFTLQGELAAAADTLTSLLNAAPSGFTGWSLPVDPLLRPLFDSPESAPVRARLAGRAH